MTQETITCSIPFTGFYESTHDAALDYALESLFMDDCGDANQTALEAAWHAIDWQQARLAYAQLYCSALASACNADWTFARLDSPRFYNYRSDEIDVMLTREELRRIFDEVAGTNWQLFIDIVISRLSPRSGFIPFYSADVADWGELDQWEAPQVSLLLEAYCNLYCDAEERDCWLVDDCDGEISNLLCDAIGDKVESVFALMEGEAA